MTLPFVTDKERKWQCFVCGEFHTDYEEYKSHVLEQHDEGRDYVLCPLGRCAAPVRDLRLHFTAKHPTEKMPETKGPLRALIWRDFGNKNKYKTRKPNFRTGTMTSMKNGGKEMHYRSGLECEIYECLEAIPQIARYTVESIKIPYYWKNDWHNYFPDLMVFYTNGRQEIWEIKPERQHGLDQNQAKWAAAVAFCEVRGWKFWVVDEENLANLRKQISRMNG
jgi:hypothetical protein